MGDGNWRRGRGICSGKAEVQIKLGIHNGESCGVNDSFLCSSITPGLVGALTAPSYSPFSVLAMYGRFHTSWIWLHTAPGSAQLSRLHSHSDCQVTSVRCVYGSRLSRIVLCLCCQGFFCHLMLALSRALATNDRACWSSPCCIR